MSQKVQGKWTQWTNLIQRDMSWSSLMRSSRHIISFSLGVTFDTLGTPVNLKRWKLCDTDVCELCGARCSIQHILSGCKVALGAVRYRYRHDSVLKSICHVLTLQLQKANSPKVVSKNKVRFIKEGGKLATSAIGKREVDSILDFGKTIALS